MNLILLFVVASLTLVGAMVAITVPNMVLAVPPDKPIRQYCYRVIDSGLVTEICVEGGEIFSNKGECKKAERDDTRDIFDPCYKK